MINVAAAIVLLSLSAPSAAQEDPYYENDGNPAGRAIAGIVVAIVVVILLILIFGLFYRRRRRPTLTALPTVRPMRPAGGFSHFAYPVRDQSYLGENRPLPAGVPAVGAFQPPAYAPPAPPPPPYHRKETFEGETVHIPVAGQPESDTRSEDYPPPPGTPPPAHVNTNLSQFSWFKNGQ